MVLICYKYKKVLLPKCFNTTKQKYDFENKLKQLVNENYNHCHMAD